MRFGAFLHQWCECRALMTIWMSSSSKILGISYWRTIKLGFTTHCWEQHPPIGIYLRECLCADSMSTLNICVCYFLCYICSSPRNTIQIFEHGSVQTCMWAASCNLALYLEAYAVLELAGATDSIYLWLTCDVYVNHVIFHRKQQEWISIFKCHLYP